MFVMTEPTRIMAAFETGELLISTSVTVSSTLSRNASPRTTWRDKLDWVMSPFSRGNTGRREWGVLSFAYFEFRETPFVTEPRVTMSKLFTDADGLLIKELDILRYTEHK